MFRTPIEIGSWDEYSTFGAATTLSGTGAFATVEIGRDFRFGDFVIGAYADFHTGGKTGSFDGKSYGCVEFEGCAEQEVSGNLKLGHSWGVNARAGMMVNPSTLVYGLLGIA